MGFDPSIVGWLPSTVTVEQLWNKLGIISFGGLAGISKLEFTAATSSEGFDIERATDLAELSWPNLVSLTSGNGNLSVANNLSGSLVVNLPLLVSISGYLSVSSNQALTLNAPVLASIGNDAFFGSVNYTSTVNLPSLTSVAGTLDSGGNISLDFPLLATIGNTLSADNSTSITIDLPSLTSIGSGGLRVQGATSLNLSAPLLATVVGDIIANGTTFTALDLSSLLPTDGTTINFNGDNLTATMVELILHRCVLAGVTTCVIDLSGGTNAGLASLNAQGQADAATLTGAGNTLSMN